MKEYIKPLVLGNDEITEGVYAASGEAESGKIGCDSKYMNGVFHAPNYGWENTMKEHYGCLGCPAYTWSNGGECGLKSHFISSGESGSYDVDAGNRMPEWERRGYTDVTIVDSTTHY